MKLHLPIALLAMTASSVLYAETVTIQDPEGTKGAFVAGPTYSGGADTYMSEFEAKIYLLQDVFTEGTSNIAPKATIKDGKGAWIFDGTGTLEGNTRNAKCESINIYNPLVVRENDVKLYNCTMTSYLATPNNYVPYLSVGGTNANLELVNSTITHNKQVKFTTASGTYTTSSVASLVLGTADGAAKVKLDNSTLHTDHFIQIGDVDGQQYAYNETQKDEDGKTIIGSDGKALVYSYLQQPGTGYVKYTTDSKGNRYQGDYLNYGPAATEIHINNGSELSAGTSLQIAHADIYVDGSGSVLKDNTLGGKSGSYFGHEKSADFSSVTNLIITNGGAFDGNGDLKTSCAGKVGNQTYVTVNGEQSTFSVAGTTYMSTDATSENAKSVIKLENGATAYLNNVEMGGMGSASIEIDGTSSIVAHEGATGTSINMYENSSIDNAGTLDLDIVMQGGNLIAQDGATFAAITAMGGTLDINGAIIMTGDLTIAGLATLAEETTVESAVTLNFAEGAYIDMQGHSVNIAALTSINVTDADGNFTLFTNVANAEQLNNVEFSYTDANGDTQVGKIEVSNGNVYVGKDTTVPEPTTATLSLLALAALAGRRRRK